MHKDIRVVVDHRYLPDDGVHYLGMEPWQLLESGSDGNLRRVLPLVLGAFPSLDYFKLSFWIWRFASSFQLSFFRANLTRLLFNICFQTRNCQQHSVAADFRSAQQAFVRGISHSSWFNVHISSEHKKLVLI